MMAEYQRPENIVRLAERLSDLGYWPVPIPAGCKGPTIAGWQNLRLTADDAKSYFSESGMLVGILHNNVLALDIDVYDEDLATAIVAEGLRRFPGALERIGQAPKSALFLRMDEPGFKVGNTGKFEKDGKSAQVEVRSVTRQIVAYGLHPDTQMPYRWPRGELWATPWHDLPEASREDVEQFRDWCEDKIKRWAGVSDPKIIDLGLQFGRQNQDEKPSADTFREALSYVPANVGYDDWLSGLMGIHDFFNGSHEGLECAKQWSAAYPDYNPHEVETKWKSFEAGKGTTYRSVLYLAKQNGADLSEMARKERAAQTFEIATHVTQTAAETPQDEEGDPLEWFEDIEPSLSSAYIVKGVIDDGAMSVIYGPSNSGKTFFALDLVFHIATGRQWRNRRVKQASVLYLAAEGGRGVKNRIAALGLTHGLTDVPLALRRAGLDLLQSEADLQHVYDLANRVKARAPDKPQIIVIDTLSRIMAGGDENSAADMTALIRNIDAIREATGAHIVLVHHTGKDTARGARGHSSLRAATDTEIEVGVVGEDGEESRAAMVTKQREHQGGETFAFTLKGVQLGTDEDGDEVTSCIIESADEAEFRAAKVARKGLGGNQKIVADTFDQLVGEGMSRPNPGGVGFPEPGRFHCVAMDDLRAHSQGKFDASNPRDAWKTAWSALTEKRGLFCAASGLVWRVDRRIR
jgi:hypothetical protein